MDPPPSTPPFPPTKNKDEFQRRSTEEEQAQSRDRRASVHYATIGEFLASLKNVQDKALGLEDYLRAVRCPEQQPLGDGDPVRESQEQGKN
ncbi:uncharacterized protein [Drosophila kikkawai]|uniref:Uncharacterized protein n=1 Tax=Drosophila kikkawai TaxID=30033 RepID=A0A6P4I1B1_DROKI|nr:uncharacterized protein LOC108074929 [Drosophila kikkawai]